MVHNGGAGDKMSIGAILNLPEASAPASAPAEAPAQAPAQVPAPDSVSSYKAAGD